MSTNTTNMGLVKPDSNELYDLAVFNGNADKLDAFFGVTICTSGTRPSSPAVKQQIFETDTQKGYAWDGDSWEQISWLIPPAATNNNPAQTIANLTDGATVAVDAAAAKLHRLSASGNRTLSSPTNAVDGRYLTIAHKAITSARTLTLATGTAGSYKFGTDITALTATVAGTTDYIGVLYNSADSRWHVISYIKGL